MSQALERIISRRKLVFGAVRFATAIPLAAACEEKEEIPTFDIPNNGRFVFIQTSGLTTANAGIERVIISSLAQTNETIVFTEYSDNVKQDLSKAGQTTIRRDGFVPFDPSFNVQESIVKILEQYQLKKPKIPTQQEVDTLQAVFQSLSRKKGEGGIYDTPPFNTDVMLVIGFNPVQSMNGKQLPDVILKARLRFIKTGLNF